MFKINERILTSKGPGIIVGFKRSSYSKTILFYLVDLDSGQKNYICPIDLAKEIK